MTEGLELTDEQSVSKAGKSGHLWGERGKEGVWKEICDIQVFCTLRGTKVTSTRALLVWECRALRPLEAGWP